MPIYHKCKVLKPNDKNYLKIKLSLYWTWLGLTLSVYILVSTDAMPHTQQLNIYSIPCIGRYTLDVYIKKKVVFRPPPSGGGRWQGKVGMLRVTMSARGWFMTRRCHVSRAQPQQPGRGGGGWRGTCRIPRDAAFCCHTSLSPLSALNYTPSFVSPASAEPALIAVMSPAFNVRGVSTCVYDRF